MEERTEGIIVRTRLLTESSLIVQWFTADAGRLSTVARGARRPKSPFRGKLDLFHEADLSFRRSTRSDLHALSEVAVRQTYPTLRTDWRRLQQAAYAVALIECSTETDTPLPETWLLFRNHLVQLSTLGPHPAAVLALELQHLSELGLAPDFSRPSLPPLAQAMAETLLQNDPNLTYRWDPNDPSLDDLAHFLQTFLLHHLGRIPRGRTEALARPRTHPRARQEEPGS